MSTYTYPQLPYALIARQSPSPPPFPKLQNQLGIAIWGAHLGKEIHNWLLLAKVERYGPQMRSMGCRNVANL